jgi:hypothetical protein
LFNKLISHDFPSKKFHYKSVYISCAGKDINTANSCESIPSRHKTADHSLRRAGVFKSKYKCGISENKTGRAANEPHLWLGMQSEQIRTHLSSSLLSAGDLLTTESSDLLLEDHSQRNHKTY